MTSTSSRPSRRRQWLVNRRLQWRFVRAMLLVLCVMAVAALVAVYLGVWATLASFGLTQDPLIVSLFNTTWWVIVLELILMAPVVMWLGIRLTHKVAGPLVRIQAALNQMSEGTFDIHISLR